MSHAKGIRTVEYRPKGDGPRLRVLYVDGQGHAWPGGKDPMLAQRAMGPVTDTLDATATIWAFLASVR